MRDMPEGQSFRAMQPIEEHENPSDVFCRYGDIPVTNASGFFRNRELCDTVVRAISDNLSNSAFQYDIWSAGSATGEEAYSIIFMFLERASSFPQGFRLFGTDINEECIDKARAGIYSNRQPHVKKYAPLLAKYTSAENHLLHVKPAPKEHVKFGIFDIRKCPRKHRFNLIVCNHVFQYYNETIQRKIVANFKEVLKPGGLMYIEGISSSIITPSGISPVDGLVNTYKAL